MPNPSPAPDRSATEALRAELLDAVPDIPRWVEARALVLSDHCGVFRGNDGWVLRNDQAGGRLVVIVGRPGRRAIDAALAGREGAEILIPMSGAAELGAQYPNATMEPAWLYGLEPEGVPTRPEQGTAPEPEPEPRHEVRRLVKSDSLDHLEQDLRDEIEGARGTFAVQAAFDGGLAVSFAYACWQTEGQFDVSIDTAQAFRRRGFARSAARALIHARLAAGKRPVWGALESNIASHRLARSLGLSKVDEIACFSLALPGGGGG